MKPPIKPTKLTVPVIKGLLCFLEPNGKKFATADGIEYSYVTKIKASIVDKEPLDEVDVQLDLIEAMQLSMAYSKLADNINLLALAIIS